MSLYNLTFLSSILQKILSLSKYSRTILFTVACRPSILHFLTFIKPYCSPSPLHLLSHHGRLLYLLESNSPLFHVPSSYFPFPTSGSFACYLPTISFFLKTFNVSENSNGFSVFSESSVFTFANKQQLSLMRGKTSVHLKKISN